MRFRNLAVVVLTTLSFGIYPVFPQAIGIAGSENITADEFLQRYEFTPFVSHQVQKSVEQNKKDFLYTIIAEKLWALQAKRLGLDTTEVIRFVSGQFEKMFVRDALFHKEIKNKVSVSEEEQIAGYLKYTSKLKVNFLYSEDETEIKDLHALLVNGVPFDSILVESPEYQEQHNPVEVVYGQMDWKIEDTLFSINPGSFTSPLYTPDGWYIFRLTDKSENIMSTENDRQEAFNSVKKIIEARKVDSYYNDYYMSFFANRKADADSKLYQLLSGELKKLFEEKYKLRGTKDDNLLTLEPVDVLKLETTLGEEKLSAAYITIGDKKLSLKYYIRLIAFDGFNVKPADIENIPKIVFSKNRSVIEQEMLADEGIKKGYNLLPEVRNDVNLWVGNYLFQALRGKFLDSVSVSNEEALAWYNKMNKEEKYPPLVNISEVLTDSASVIELVLNELKNGKDIHQLALKYSKRERIVKNKGETGLVSINSLGEVGRIASTLEVGEVFGPVKLDEGLSVFKLIDKKDERIVKPRSFESRKDEIIKELSFAKLNAKIKDYTVYLAQLYGADIYEEALKNVEVTNINSFGVRHLGFGGKITAVPLVAPNYNWFNEYIGKKELIQ